MKVIKSILIAVVLGIVYVGIGLMKIDNIKMSEILLANTMSGVEFYPQYISTFSFEYIPIFGVCEIKSVNRHSMISDGAVSSWNELAALVYITSI